MHLDDYKRIEGTKTFRVLHAIFVIRANPEARKTKVRKYSLKKFYLYSSYIV